MGRLNLYLVLITCVMLSCRQPKDLVFHDVRHFALKNVGMRSTSVTMDVQLYNPNAYKMKLKYAHLDLFINDKHMGLVSVPHGMRVPKLDTFALPIELDVDLKNVLPNIFQLLSNSTVDIRLTGKVKAGRHGINITIPVDYKGKQDVGSGIKF